MVGRRSAVAVIVATMGAARVERMVIGFPRESDARTVEKIAEEGARVERYVMGFPDGSMEVSSTTVGGDDDSAGVKVEMKVARFPSESLVMMVEMVFEESARVERYVTVFPDASTEVSWTTVAGAEATAGAMVARKVVGLPSESVDMTVRTEASETAGAMVASMIVTRPCASVLGTETTTVVDAGTDVVIPVRVCFHASLQKRPSQLEGCW